MPSAIPRNIEKVPSVTISGGRRSRAIRTAFKPPPAHPNKSAVHAAKGTGRFQSRYIAPKTTAARPIIDPTDKSIPPVMITGVNAIASRPSSTLNRSTSKKLLAVRKFSAIAENIATSQKSAPIRIHRPAGRKRRLNCLCAASCNKMKMTTSGIDDDRRQNDPSLKGSFPISAHAQKGQRRTDSSQQDHAKNGACNGSDSSGYCCPSDNNSGDDLHFETQSCITRNLIKPYGIENCSEPRECARQDKNGKNDQRRINAGQPCTFRIRSSRVNRAAGAHIARAPS